MVKILKIINWFMIIIGIAVSGFQIYLMFTDRLWDVFIPFWLLSGLMPISIGIFVHKYLLKKIDILVKARDLQKGKKKKFR